MKADTLFSLDKTVMGEYISSFEHPWQALPGLKKAVERLGQGLSEDEYREPVPSVWIHKSAVVSSTAKILAPTVICKGAEIRHCAFIRGGAVIGEGAVVGNSTEVKNSIISDYVQIPHFNYVGDSILGHRAHLGAGAVTSNVKSDKGEIRVSTDFGSFPTGLRKLGALIADNAEIGCGCVLNPGTVIGRNTTVYPLSSVRGTVGDNMIYKSEGNTVSKG